MNNSASSARQDQPSLLDHLLVDYLERIDQGEAVDRKEYVERFPEFASALEAFFNNEDAIGRISSQIVAEKSAVAVNTDEPLSRSTQQSHSGNRVEFPSEQRDLIQSLFNGHARYRLIRHLGEGGMGTVYLVEDRDLSRAVALKLPRTEALRDASRRQRFITEARSAASLRHPNVCPVYDVGEIKGLPFITMAYIEGTPLSQYIAGKEPYPQRQAASLVRKLAEALQDAHARQVVHRDLKPGNIMIDQRNEPIIMDFGLALQIDREVRVTKTGLILGTPAYMSPEQICNNPGELGPRTDIYSLGVIFYELLTGRVPFLGSTPEVLVKVLKDEPRPVISLNPTVDPALAQICHKMMAKLPSDRFESMSDVMTALQSHSESMGAHRSGRKLLDETDYAPNAPSARTQTLEHSPKREIRRRVWVVASLFAGIIAAGGVAAVAHFWGTGGSAVRIVRDDSIAPDMSILIDDTPIEERPQPIEIAPGRHVWSVMRGDSLLRTQPFEVREKQSDKVIVTLLEGKLAEEQPVLTPNVSRPVPNPSNELPLIHFAGTSRRIYVASGNDIVLWDCETQKEIRRFSSKAPQPIQAFDYHNERERLAIAFPDEVRIVDATSGELKRSIPRDAQADSKVAFTRDGTKIAVAARRAGVSVFDVETGTTSAQLGDDSKEVTAIAYHPSRPLLATAHHDGRITVWDLATGKPQKHFPARKRPQFSIAFHPGGDSFATGGDAGECILWDLNGGEISREFVGHSGRVESLVFSSDGTHLVSGSADRTIRIWETRSGAVVQRWSGKDPIEGVAISSDDGLLASADHGGRIELRDVSLPLSTSAGEAGLIAELVDHHGTVYSVAFDAGGRRLVSAGRNRIGENTPDTDVRLWSIADRKLIRRFKSNVKLIQKVRFNHGGDEIIALSDEGQFQFWNTDSGERTHDADGIGFQVIGRGTAKDFDVIRGRDRIVVVGSEGHTVIKLTDLSLYSHWKASDAEVSSVHVTADGQQLLSSSRTEQAIGIWNLPLVQDIGRIISPDDPVRSMAVTPDGNWVLGTSMGGFALWNARTRQMIQTWREAPNRGHFESRLCAISPDGRMIALTTQEREPSITLFDAATGQLLQQLRGHRDSIHCLAFSPDGRMLASAGMDSKIRIWRTPALPDRERRAAEWVINTGGKVAVISTWMKKGWLEDVGQIPDGSIECGSVIFHNNPKVTDDGLKNLAGLRSLTELQLVNTPISSAGLEHLQGLTVLTYLSLTGSRVTDDGMQDINRFKNLETLLLDDTPVTGRSLPHLIGLSRLTTLVLNGTDIQDADLVYLQGLPELRFLRIGKTKVTNAGLEYLKGIKHLEQLDYRGSAVTDAAAEDLKKTFPNLSLTPPK